MAVRGRKTDLGRTGQRDQRASGSVITAARAPLPEAKVRVERTPVRTNTECSATLRDSSRGSRVICPRINQSASKRIGSGLTLATNPARRVDIWDLVCQLAVCESRAT